MLLSILEKNRNLSYEFEKEREGEKREREKERKNEFLNKNLNEFLKVYHVFFTLIFAEQFRALKPAMLTNTH